MSLMPPMTPSGSATATSSGSASTAALLPKPGQQCRLTNPAGGTQVVAYVAFGNSAIAATATNGVAIAPGNTFVVTPPSDATHFSVIAASAAATVIYVSTGIGE